MLDYRQFYIELGRLLYAVAKSDDYIEQSEKLSVLEIVKKELIPIEISEDEFGSQNAFYTEFEFESLMEKNAGANQSYESFIRFMKKNRIFIDDKLKNLSLCVAKKLAHNHEINRVELYILQKLEEDLASL